MRLRRPAAVASRRRPPPAVVLVAMVTAALPMGLLAWMGAAVVAPRLVPAAVLVATAAVAAWGARVGVLTGGNRRGLLLRGATLIVRSAALLCIAAVVRVVSSHTAVADLVGLPLLVPGVLLAVGFGVGRAVGRIHRRQSDPLATHVVHRRADTALMAMALAGVIAVTTVTVAAWTSDATWTPRRWTSLLWLTVAVTVVVSGRPAVLRARTGTSPASSGGWMTAVLPLTGVFAASILCLALVLSAGLEVRLRDALPALPSWRLGLSDPATGRATPPPRTWEESTTGVAWQILALVAIIVLLTVVRVARRRRRAEPHGAGLSLWMLLRSMLGMGRPARVVAGDDAPDTGDPVQAGADVPLAAHAPDWIQRLRPRPRDPAAAILHDYRLVQRRLPSGRRRHPSETVLAHAEREHVPDLAELATMVCAVRFAEHVPTGADAERSRVLVRRLLRG